MGCFLGCFGYSSKRKRRKPANRIIPGDQRLGGYEPLDSVSINLDIKEEPINSDSQLSRKPKEPLNYRIRKKVSFNLNLQTYEPIPKEESTNHLWGSDEESNNERGNETGKEGQSSSLRRGDSIPMTYPSNYRYRNCIDSYHEEDEIAYEESDLDDDDDYDDEEEDDDAFYDDTDYLKSNQEDLSARLNSLSVSSQNRDSLTLLAEGKTRTTESLDDSHEGILEPLGTNRNARDRSRYVHSVLNPVENLTQWKAVKARGMPPGKRQRKENVTLEQEPEKPFVSKPNFSHSTFLMQDVAVDASLSNWLASKPSSITKGSATSAGETMPSKKSSFDGTHSWRNREDMPILDITNLEA